MALNGREATRGQKTDSTAFSVAHELSGMRAHHEIGYVNCISAVKDYCWVCGIVLKMKGADLPGGKHICIVSGAK